MNRCKRCRQLDQTMASPVGRRFTTTSGLQVLLLYLITTFIITSTYEDQPHRRLLPPRHKRRPDNRSASKDVTRLCSGAFPHFRKIFLCSFFLVAPNTPTVHHRTHLLVPRITSKHNLHCRPLRVSRLVPGVRYCKQPHSHLSALSGLLHTSNHPRVPS